MNEKKPRWVWNVPWYQVVVYAFFGQIINSLVVTPVFTHLQIGWK